MSCTEHIAAWKVILVVEQTAWRDEGGREGGKEETERAERGGKGFNRGKGEIRAEEKKGNEERKAFKSAASNMSN